MKHILYFRLTLRLLLGIIFIIFFTNYGNKVVHPDLNAMMLGAFLKQNSNPNLSDPAFKNYTFHFLQGVTLKGTAVIKDGLFKDGDIGAAVYADIGNGYFEEGLDIKAIKYIAKKGLDYVLYSKEGPAEKTVKSWIVDGGFSADVPEVPASLRHFYDPTRPAGDRYLTDIANAKIMGSLQYYVLTNPQIDAVQWALGKPGEFATGAQDHQYTWESGKLWIQMALKETNKDKKNRYMANAWRALGETLHMIADNGCPPHVRNDAHPSPFFNNNTLFGNPDPYEELMDKLRMDKPDEFARFGKGTPDKDLKDRFASMKTTAEIAHEMAVYTNTNFVSNETISGTDRNGKLIMQITHPEYPYKAPLLQNMTYNEKDYTYSTSNGVKQCADRDYFGKTVPQICEPRVTMECVKSQAKLLIPNIIEAGKNVIKLYIPKLQVEILSAENNVVKGIVRHTSDAEYTSEIKYSGAVKITLKDKYFKIKNEIEVEAKNGLFESNQLQFGDADNKILALVEFGGIAVQSDYFICSKSEVVKGVYGIYEGEYKIQLNKENILNLGKGRTYVIYSSRDATRTKEDEEAANEAARIEINKRLISDIETFVSGTGVKPVVKFQIGNISSAVSDNDVIARSYEPSGHPYYVKNISETIVPFLPTYLTPIKGTSPQKIIMECFNNGFKLDILLGAKFSFNNSYYTGGNHTITIRANFDSNNLSGYWIWSDNGLQLLRGDFYIKKIQAMNY